MWWWKLDKSPLRKTTEIMGKRIESTKADIMIEKEELETLTSLDNDEEKVAREMGLLRPLDVLLIFLFLWKGKLWYEKHGKARMFSSDEFYRQLEDDYGIRKEKAEEAVYRIKRHGLIRESTDGKTGIPYLEMFNLPTFERMGIPRNWKERISENEFKELLHERISTERYLQRD